MAIGVAAGTTVPALKRALAGSASVQMKDGAVKGIDIAGSIRGAKATLGAALAGSSPGTAYVESIAGIQ